MTVRLANNARDYLAANISSVSTSLDVQDASTFPVLLPGEWFNATIESAGGAYEIVRVTGITGTTFAITRGQEDTIAIPFVAGATVKLNLTVQNLEDHFSATAEDIVATLLDAAIAAEIGVTIQAYDADTAKLDVAQTFTQTQTITNSVIIDSAYGDTSQLFLARNGVNRWMLLRDSSAESGSDAGSNLALYAANDAGGIASGVFTVVRATGVLTFSQDPKVPDEAYGAGWNGSLEVPTKNAVYDKIEGLSAVYQPLDADLTTWAGVTPSANGISLVTAANYAAMRTLLDLEAGTDFYSIAATNSAIAAVISDTAYGVGWDGVTTIAPSKNAVYDKIAALAQADISGLTTTSAPSFAAAILSSTYPYFDMRDTDGTAGVRNFRWDVAAGKLTLYRANDALSVFDYIVELDHSTRVANFANRPQAGGVNVAIATDISDTVYGAGWNASTLAPTQNAVYDKIEGLSAVYQPLDADLTTWAGLTPSANAQSLVTAANYAAMRTLLGLGTAALLSPAANINSILGAADYAAVRTLLGLVIGTNVQAYDADLTTWAGVTPGSGVVTFLATPSSANLAAAVTGETGSGALVFATSPALVTPALGVATATGLTVTGSASAAAPTRVVNAFDNAAIVGLTIESDRATPTTGDYICLDFKLSDSAGNQDTFARFRALAGDVTSGTEDGVLYLGLVVNGTLTDRFYFSPTEFLPIGDNATALGRSTSYRFSDLYLGDGAVLSFNNDILFTHSLDKITLTGGQLILTDGSVAAPSFGFASAAGTGMYWTANELCFANNGGLYFYIGTGRIQAQIPFWGANGSVGAPQYSFSSDSNTGFHNGGESDVIYASCGATNVTKWGPWGMLVAVGSMFTVDGTAAAPGYNFTNDQNTGIYRIGADNIGLSLGGALAVDFATTGMRARTRASTETGGTLTAASANAIVQLATAPTIPASVFTAGDEILLINTTGSSMTMTQGGGGTQRKAGTGTTGNLTIPAYGAVPIYFESATEWYASGVS